MAEPPPVPASPVPDPEAPEAGLPCTGPGGLEMAEGDWRYVLALQAGYLPLVALPAVCCAPLAPAVGMLFVAGALARSSYARFAAVQAVAAELLLAAAGLAAGFALHAAGGRQDQAAWIVAAIAAVMAAVGVGMALGRRRWVVPLLGPMLLRLVFKGEPTTDGN